MQETSVQFLGQKFPWRRDRLPTPVFLGFPVGSDGKESACNVGDLGLISRLGRFPGKGKGYLLQYSGLENSTDCIVHGVAKSQTRLSDLHFDRGRGIPPEQDHKYFSVLFETVRRRLPLWLAAASFSVCCRLVL